MICAVHVPAQTPLYKQPAASVESRVKDLLGRMTVNEKIGQLCCPLGWEMYTKTSKGVVPSELYKERMRTTPIGSFWAVLRADPWTQKTLETGLNPQSGAKALNALQKYAIDSTRLGIPILFAEECPHGHMAIGTTVFPTSLAQASTWNEKLMYTMGETIALEARLQGANIGYGPVLDIAREPRWSRMEETFGEDPVLTSTLGVAFMKGMQGEAQNDGKHLFSTLKHFAAYGIPESGHNGARANIGMRQLFSDYLPPFKKAVEAGVGTIMTSYNSIDGIPCTANKYLLSDILRKEWGFNGFVYSDLSSIEGITGARVARNHKEASALALKAGVDMDLGGNAYGKNLRQALKEGLIGMQDIDRAVANVLRLKFRMGLFENPYVSPEKAGRTVRSQTHKKLARQVAREGVVLLKNEGILPLSKQLKNIAVIGPNADSRAALFGNYNGTADHYVTFLEGIQRIFSGRVLYAEGCHLFHDRCAELAQPGDRYAEAVAVAKAADVVILCLGLDATLEGEEGDTGNEFASGDKADLLLPEPQRILLKKIATTGKPVILVTATGSAIQPEIQTDGWIQAWYPGSEGGTALAEILFGQCSPSGKLPVTFYADADKLPAFTDYRMQGRTYRYTQDNLLYPFGYGLTYGKIVCIDLQYANGTAIVIIENQGPLETEDVIQIYVQNSKKL